MFCENLVVIPMIINMLKINVPVSKIIYANITVTRRMKMIFKRWWKCCFVLYQTLKIKDRYWTSVKKNWTVSWKICHKHLFLILKIFGHCLRHKTRKEYENISTFTSYYPLPEAMRKAFLSNHTSKDVFCFYKRRKKYFCRRKIHMYLFVIAFWNECKITLRTRQYH